tara:strand:- start:5230 stop:5415 length:186 start_codon:yes stop_codon:yes gene_type:complete
MGYNNLMEEKQQPELLDDYVVEGLFGGGWVVRHRDKTVAVYRFKAEAMRMADQLKVSTRDG